MRSLKWSILLGLISLTTTAGAEVKKVSIAAEGVLWLSCSYRLEKAIQRLEGVEKVRVHLEPTRAEVTPRAGAWVEASRLRSAVKNAGFKPGEIYLTVTGTLTEWKDQPALRLSLNGRERLVVLQVEPKSPEAFERLRPSGGADASPAFEVEGRLVDVAESDDRTAPTALRVQRVVEKR
jgi:copper chaperone CopZ